MPRLLLGSVGLVAVVVAVLVLAVPGVEAQEEENCDPKPTGTWKVLATSSPVVCRDRTIIVENIEVGAGGSLTLDNVTLLIDAERDYDSETGGNVIRATTAEYGGPATRPVFIITDSVVAALDPARRPTMHISHDAVFRFEDSMLRDFYSLMLTLGSPINPMGEGEFLIEDSHLQRVEHGLLMREQNAPVITGNLFEHHAGSNGIFILGPGSPTIENNTFVGYYAGISVDGSGQPKIANNTFTHNQFGVGIVNAATASVWSVHDNDIYNNYRFAPEKPTGEASFYGDGTMNWWEDDPPIASRIWGADYTPWRTEPVHPERLPTPVITGIPDTLHRGEAFAANASESLPSQHYGFPIARVDWDFDDDNTAQGIEATHAYPKPGFYDVRVRVWDEKNISRLATHTIEVVNRAPSIDALDFTPSPPMRGQLLGAVVQSSDPDEDALTFTYQWNRNGALHSTDATILATDVDVGDAWSLSVAATDPYGASATATVTAVVPNHEPSITSLDVAPDAPGTVDDLVASVTASDVDGHDVTYTYEWRRDGQVQDVSGPVVPSSLTAKDDSWSLRVTPSDGYDQGEAREAVVVIQDTPPTIHSVSASPQTVAPGEATTLALDASDTDGDAVSVSWRLPDGTTRVGASVQAAFDEVGQQSITYEVMAGGAVQTGALQVDVAYEPIAVHEVGIAPSPPIHGVDLEAVVEWSGPDGTSLTYAWHRNGVAQDMSSGPIVPSTLIEALDEWTVTVTASFQGDADSATASVVIPNRQPTIEAVSIAPATPRTGDDLAATVTGSDPDDHDVSYTYQWLRDGVEQATGSVLDAEMTRNGETWTLRVTPHDGDDAGTPVEQTALIANTAPVIHGVDVMPERPHAGEPVTLSLDALDVDGDALTVTWSLPSGSTTGMTIDEVFPEAGTYVVSYHVTDGLDAQQGSVEIHVSKAPPVVIHGARIATQDVGGLEAVVDATGPTGMQLTYQWWHNGALMEVDGPVLDVQLGPLDEWMVQVTASFGEDSVAREARLTVPNHRPLAEVTISPHWPRAGDDLVATAQTSDPDGHAVSVQWEWSRNGVTQGVVGDTVPGDLVRKGDTWSARAIPHDGHQNGVSGEASVVIQNTPPVVDAVSVAPAHTAVGRSVALSLSASDVDGDDWTVTWLLPDSTESGDRIVVAFLKAGSHEVYYEVSDGIDASTGSLVVEIVEHVPPSASGRAPATPSIGALHVPSVGDAATPTVPAQMTEGGDDDAVEAGGALMDGSAAPGGGSKEVRAQESRGAGPGEATSHDATAGSPEGMDGEWPARHHVAAIGTVAAALALLVLVAVHAARRGR